MKPIQNKIKKDYSLSLALFAVGNVDAQYMAGLIADEIKMNKNENNKYHCFSCSDLWFY